MLLDYAPLRYLLLLIFAYAAIRQFTHIFDITPLLHFAIDAG